MISVIILSSDGYSDCWDPLFGSLLKYFPEVKDYEIILSTNTLSYEFAGLDINCVAHGLDVPWSKRLKSSLKLAKNNIVFVMVEDFFLRSRINTTMFNEFVNLLKTDPLVDHIRLTITLNKLALKPSPIKNLEEIEANAKMRFTYLPGLWKKEVLEKYVMDFETPFMSETMGRYRSFIYRHGFYAVSKDIISTSGQFYDTDPSGIIFKGKWPRWVPALFEKEGIEMDFSIRGIASLEFRKQTRINSKKEILKDPKSLFYSVMSLIKLYIKSKFVNVK